MQVRPPVDRTNSLLISSMVKLSHAGLHHARLSVSLSSLSTLSHPNRVSGSNLSCM